MTRTSSHADAPAWRASGLLRAALVAFWAVAAACGASDPPPGAASLVKPADRPAALSSAIGPGLVARVAPPPEGQAALAAATPRESLLAAEACEAACANVRSVLARELADLPDGGRSLSVAMGDSVGAGCVSACQQRGDPESVACVRTASTLLELGGCDARLGEGQGARVLPGRPDEPGAEPDDRPVAPASSGRPGAATPRLPAGAVQPAKNIKSRNE